MAKLTAKQVQHMLLPVAQFSPAVYAAQEILASVEQAEKDNAQLAKDRAALEAAVAELKRLEIEFQGRTNQARKDFHAYQDSVEQAKADIEKSFKPLRDEQEKIKKEIAELQKQREAQRVDKNNEFLSWEKKIADSKKRYEDFKSSI